MKKNHKIRKLNKILKKVKNNILILKDVSDEELILKTAEFKKRLKEGENLDSILPEAYAVVSEADRRILNKEPRDVQIIGAIAMHKGFLCEMNTGEGKTLVATMPLYLNALEGKGAILVTTNEYLALRDSEEMGKVYEFLGLSVATSVKEDASDHFTNEEKREIYSADIVYTTHSVLGFDYLFDNLAKSNSERFLREFNYVIIDEADSVLLDSAQTPLVISGAPRVQSNHYELSDFFVTTLINGVDYIKEDKKVWLTDDGVKRAERFFGIDNFYEEKNFEINRHVTLALRAHELFEKEKDYVVNEKEELVLLDNATGRMLPGVKMRGGQHQALEQKEKIKVTQENRSVASITYQNLFLMFPKMSGMSGTINDAKDELLDVYGKKVLVIPPHKSVKRKDYKDLFYVDFEKQFDAAIELALKVHNTNQPVLIVASTIAETEYISRLLINHKIPHNVLNANNAFWEAAIIKEAGKLGAVTVATSMAGRGTDIKLEEGVKELGGLYVIGVGRMINIRQERQARGRAGRQGDPGASRFFCSLEDEVVNIFDSEKIGLYIDGKRHISNRRIKRYINKAQRIKEEQAIAARKKALDYDLIMKLQRQLLYDTRNGLLNGKELTKEDIIQMSRENINEFVDSNDSLNSKMISRYILDNISYRLNSTALKLFGRLDDKKVVKDLLLEIVKEAIEEQEEKLCDKMNEFMRIAALYAIDNAWIEEVDYLQQLQSAVSGRAVAQRNVVYEYHKDAFDAYKNMEKTIRRDIMRNILLSDVTVDEDDKIHIMYP